METARRMIRRVVGPSATLYRLGSDMLGMATIARKEGLGMVPRMRALAAGPGDIVELRLSALAHPIAVRSGTNDIPTILNNVIREEYGAYPPEAPPRTMIDAGAFIGDSAAYFLSRYPGLRVLALEPEAANLELARRNLAPYGERVTLMHKALAGRDGTVRFGGASIGAAIGKGEAEVEATSVPTLMSMLPYGRVDILKMDIEGAERDVCETRAGDWLPAVGMVIVELHGPAITAAVTGILRDNGFGVRVHRSLSYFSRSFA